MRILYSFGLILGRPGIGYAAEQQILAYRRLGHEVTVMAPNSAIWASPEIGVRESVRLLPWRALLKVAGMARALAWHDRVVARAIAREAAGYDVVHAWPVSSERTLGAARARGALAVREAPNTHTAHAVRVVREEHARLGLPPPRGTHDRSAAWIARERREYAAADLVLAPSPFAVETFVAEGVPAERLAVKGYGFDPDRFAMDPGRARGDMPTFAFVARCEPRKGLHHALEAWKRSGLRERTRFLVVGAFDPDYRARLEADLAHPNVEILGFVSDLRTVYARTDALVLPSVEEGSALVTYDAQGAGCALLVSRAAGARMTDGVEGLEHEPGDVEALARHMRRIVEEPEVLRAMQRAGHANARGLTWDAMTAELIEVFRHAIEARRTEVAVPAGARA
jgi:glycosyltransferase involved in cell wall biosynthesis